MNYSQKKKRNSQDKSTENCRNSIRIFSVIANHTSFGMNASLASRAEVKLTNIDTDFPERIVWEINISRAK